MQNNLLIFFSIALLLGTLGCLKSQQPLASSREVYDGWQVGVQTWSFRKFTLFEAIDKTRSLELNGIQAFPGQRISADIDAPFGPDLTDKQKQEIKDKLQCADVSIYAFGMVAIPTEQEAARKLFEFTKDMDIEILVAEPAFEQFDLIDRLCQEYQIKLAIHNHPKPTKYWNPDTVVKVFQGRSQLIGACADVGHWVRSGLDPVACLKKLQGRIFDIHMKEVEDGGNGDDVIWGTGQAHTKAILEELHRQGYQGTFSIEYENHWDNNIPHIRQSVDYFNSIARTLKPKG